MVGHCLGQVAEIGRGKRKKGFYYRAQVRKIEPDTDTSSPVG